MFCHSRRQFHIRWITHTQEFPFERALAGRSCSNYCYFFFCFMLREPPKIFYQHSTDCRSVVLFSFYSYSFVMAFWVNYFVCDCVQTQYRSFVCWKKKKISQNSRLTQYIAMNSASSILSGMQCILASNYIHP